MQAMNVKEENGFVRYVIIGDLYREILGNNTPAGKARITFYVPRHKEEFKSKENDKQTMDWLESLSRYIVMDVLFFKDMENGWVEHFVDSDDILEEKVEAVQTDACSIVGLVNEYLTKNGFGLWVR